MKKTVLFIVSLLLLSACVAQGQIVPQTVNIENELLTDYLDHSDYDVNDYTYTNMYLPEESRRWDSPAPAVFSWKWKLAETVLEIRENEADEEPFISVEIEAGRTSCKVYNLIPGMEYHYRLVDLNNADRVYKTGSFSVEGRRRMIRADNVRNIRDFGGLTTDDGRMLRYGLMYRGACMDFATKEGQVDTIFTEEGWKVLHDVIKIGADIDLRAPNELNLKDEDPDNDMVACPLGSDVEYHLHSISHFGGIQTSNKYGPTIKTILDCLQRGRNVFIHCSAGADRTGILSFLLGGMAGVCENDLARDYELTCMSKSYVKHTRNSGKPYYYADSIAYIKENFPGKTLSEKIQEYLIKKQGITRKQIAAFQQIMVCDKVTTGDQL